MEAYDAYEFISVITEDFKYYFVTRDDIAYEIKFKYLPYLFELNEPFSSETYEFVISILDSPTQLSATPDQKIGLTVSQIFEDFYSRNNQKVTVYICDSSDEKQLVRQRKFDSWFKSFNAKKYFKIDAILKNKLGEISPVSIIFQLGNPYALQIIDAFRKITESYNQK